MNPNDNPYSTPIDTREGQHDHRLFWRIVKFTWACIFVLLIVDAIVSVSYSTTAQARNATPAETIRQLFLGWDKH